MLMKLLVIATILALSSGEERKPSPNARRFILDTGGLDSDQQTLIQDGFNAARDIADRIDKLDFAGVVGKLAGAASSFLGALGPFVGTVLSLFGSHAESPELQLLKTMFTEVENRFDQVDLQFSQLRREVHFVPTQVAFNAIESNINAVHYQFLTLSHASSNASYMYQSHEYIRTYDRTYSSDGVKLFNSIMHDGLVSGGLFSEFMKYSNYDHKATQQFMLGTQPLNASFCARTVLCRADTKPRQSLSESGLGKLLFAGQG